MSQANGIREAIGQLRALGVTVERDAERTVVSVRIRDNGDQALSWVAAIPTIRVADCMGSRVTDDGLRSLSSMRSVSRICVSNTQITAVGIRHLIHLDTLRDLSCSPKGDVLEALDAIGQLRQLEKLTLDATIPAGGMWRLRGLQQLTTLHLSGSDVPDSEFEHIAALRHLRDLRISNDIVTDEAVKYIAQLSELELLGLSSPHLTDAVFVHLQKLTRLRELVMSRGSWRGQGVSLLAQCPSLTKLRLLKCNIDDSAIVELTTLTSVRELDLALTQLTDEGVAKLRKQMPWCHVDFWRSGDYGPIAPQEPSSRTRPDNAEDSQGKQDRDP